MGKLAEFPDKNKLSQNTILIFMSDNGSVKTGVFNAGMTGGKCTRTEGGHRVPFFFRWPGGNLPEPQDTDTPSQVQDLFPTLIDLCNLKTPANAAFNGVSLKPLLQGKSFPDRMFVVQYHQNDVQKYDAAIVWNQWRLLPLWGDQLYDISKDMVQENDVAEAHPEIVRKMKNFYEEWWAEVEPGIDNLVPTHIGSPNQREVILFSSDWEDVRADGNNGPRQATERAKKGEEFTGGIWNIRVHKTGNYRVELRRYPREAGAAICAAVPAFKPRFGEPLPAGIPLDVTLANLVTANGEFESPVSKDDESAVFNVDLNKGESELKAWFGNEKEPVVCGAYYAYVRLNE
ncbi:MAG: sulfatase-like hydrolase/transferase [Prolixibacteraceae bacterium]